MNVVNAIQRRENGFGLICDYDIPLYRLTCYHDAVYRGITVTSSDPLVTFNSESPVFACRFSTIPGYECILALANEDGCIALQDTTVQGKFDAPLKGMQAHRNAIFDVAWMPGESKLVTVSGDHTARLWDVNKLSMSVTSQISCFEAHTRSVKTAVFRPEDKAVFATGARDGKIMIWDIRANQPKPDKRIEDAHTGACVRSFINNTKRKMLSQISRAQSITGLAFQDEYTLISCAAGDGLIKVWDLRKSYTCSKKEPIAKYALNYAGNSTKNGFSSLLICPARITLYASCMDDVIYAYDTSSYNNAPVAEYYGHQNRTYYVKTCLSADGRYLASGSSDDHAYIWNTSRPGIPLVKLSGHTEEVTCIEWCSVSEIKIVTCSDDSCHRIWKVGYEHKIENEEVKIRGRAEPVLGINTAVTLETPPHIRIGKRITRSNTPLANPGPSDESGTDHRLKKLNTPDTMQRTKRNFFQMTAESKYERKFTLSPIDEHEKVDTKRAHVDNSSSRKLFNINEEIAPNFGENYDSDEPGTSQSTVNSGDAVVPFSPTINLPNFVMDGTAPHLLQISPQKHKNIDWLTKIRKEWYERRQTGEIMPGRSCSPKNQKTPTQRSTRSRSHEPQKVTKAMKSSAISRLNFFKTVGKDCKKNSSSEDGSIVPSTSIS